MNAEIPIPGHIRLTVHWNTENHYHVSKAMSRKMTFCYADHCFGGRVLQETNIVRFVMTSIDSTSSIKRTLGKVPCVSS